MAQPAEKPRSDLEEIVHLNQRLSEMEMELKMEQILRKNVEELAKQLHGNCQTLACVAAKANEDSRRLLELLLVEGSKPPRGKHL